MERNDYVLRSDVIHEIKLYCARHPDRMSGDKDFLPGLLFEIRDIIGHDPVRCRECKHCEAVGAQQWLSYGGLATGHCGLLDIAIDDYFYCPLGVREVKEDENET